MVARDGLADLDDLGRTRPRMHVDSAPFGPAVGVVLVAAPGKQRRPVLLVQDEPNILVMRRALARPSFRTTTQGGRRDCLYEDGTGRFRTRPDILICEDDPTALVVETKWKHMTLRIDDLKQGVSQADVY